MHTEERRVGGGIKEIKGGGMRRKEEDLRKSKNQCRLKNNEIERELVSMSQDKFT